MSSSNLILSPDHEKLLKQFKSDVSDILRPYHTDAVLLKFLRAKNYNLRKAESNFRTVDSNRKIFGVDKVLETYVPDVVAEKCEATGFIGFAKDGSAIRFAGGKTDFYGFIMSMSAFDLCLYFTHMMEHDIMELQKENKRTGREVNEITYIMDMEGSSIKQLAYKSVIEMGLDFSALVQDHYPEIWRNIFVVNAPWFTDKVFNLFKTIMRASLIEKIHIIPKSATAETLLKYIDADVLPAFLGGKRYDSNGDPRCTEFVKFGCKVPVEYYAHNRNSFIMSSDPGVETVDIGARSVYNYPIVVKDAGSKIHIEFRTENGCIYCSMYLREFGPDPDVLDLPSSNEHLDEFDEGCRVRLVSAGLRVQCHMAPIDADALAVWPGIYILQFNNMSSWFTSKKLLIRVAVTAPEDKKMRQTP